MYLWRSVAHQNYIYLLTPWRRVLPEKLTGLQLVKKFPAFHGTRRFFTALTSVRHLSILGQPNPVHIQTSHLPETHLNFMYHYIQDVFATINRGKLFAIIAYV